MHHLIKNFVCTGYLQIFKKIGKVSRFNNTDGIYGYQLKR